MRTDPFRFGTPPRPKHKRNMLKRAIKRGYSEKQIERIALDGMPRADFFGFHPTKSGPGRT